MFNVCNICYMCYKYLKISNSNNRPEITRFEECIIQRIFRENISVYIRLF